MSSLASSAWPSPHEQLPGTHGHRDHQVSSQARVPSRQNQGQPSFPSSPRWPLHRCSCSSRRNNRARSVGPDPPGLRTHTRRYPETILSEQSTAVYLALRAKTLSANVMKLPRFWIRYGNKLAMLALLLGALRLYQLYATAPERAARTDAHKISGWIEYDLQEELFRDVHARVDPTNNTCIIVSGTVTNKQDLDRIRALLVDSTVEWIPMTINVTVVGDDSS